MRCNLAARADHRVVSQLGISLGLAELDPVIVEACRVEPARAGARHIRRSAIRCGVKQLPSAVSTGWA